MSSKNTTRKVKRIFKKNEYSSNDGILTSVWGPSMWHSMHSISFNYPINPTAQNKKEYRDFYIFIFSYKVLKLYGNIFMPCLFHF